jgi:ankyrin repeat protein
MAAGSIEIVKLLINLVSNAQQLDVYLAKKNKHGQTPIELAVGHNQVDLLELFVNKKPKDAQESVTEQ